MDVHEIEIPTVGEAISENWGYIENGDFAQSGGNNCTENSEPRSTNTNTNTVRPSQALLTGHAWEPALLCVPSSFIRRRRPIAYGSLRRDPRKDLPAPPCLPGTAMRGAGPRRFPGQLRSPPPPSRIRTRSTPTHCEESYTGIGLRYTHAASSPPCATARIGYQYMCCKWY